MMDAVDAVDDGRWMCKSGRWTMDDGCVKVDAVDDGRWMCKSGRSGRWTMDV